MAIHAGVVIGLFVAFLALVNAVVALVGIHLAFEDATCGIWAAIPYGFALFLNAIIAASVYGVYTHRYGTSQTHALVVSPHTLSSLSNYPTLTMFSVILGFLAQDNCPVRGLRFPAYLIIGFSTLATVLTFVFIHGSHVTAGPAPTNFRIRRFNLSRTWGIWAVVLSGVFALAVGIVAVFAYANSTTNAERRTVFFPLVASTWQLLVVIYILLTLKSPPNQHYLASAVSAGLAITVAVVSLTATIYLFWGSVTVWLIILSIAATLAALVTVFALLTRSTVQKIR